jgi:basic amino acid/polyamine antiporter, APA family
MAEPTTVVEDKKTGFIRGLGLLDSTMIVAGSMIGSGIFLVSADIARQVGSPGWLLLVWVVTGLLTVAGALSYGELAAMMPKAGGVYVYLREAFSPLWGFLYGWTFFMVIQAGGLAAVAVGFASYLGEIVPQVSSSSWLIKPIDISKNYAVSLSWPQFVAILLLVFLTFINTRGLRFAKLVQNVFTSAKTLALIGLILVCVILFNADAVARNFGNLWTPRNASDIQSGLGFIPTVSAASGTFGLFIAFCAAQVGSIFAADGWYYITFTAGEVRNPKRNIPLSLVAGTVLVISLYLLANVAYLVTLPLEGNPQKLAAIKQADEFKNDPLVQADPDKVALIQTAEKDRIDPLVLGIQNAAGDRVATASLNVTLGGVGAVLMAIAIMISTFGANNGLILAGARVFYTMARDGLFFRPAGKLNRNHVPGIALLLQCVWSCVLVLPRTRLYNEDGSPLMDAATGMQAYGSLYNNLLDYVVFAILIFFVLTITALFVLRFKRPDAERPYRAFGYPIVPAIYIIAAATIAIVLLLYKTQTTWPGLVIVLTGIPIYFIWRKFNRPMTEPPLQESD